MKVIAGARLGSYEILETLGAGGMGEVYRARDTRLNRDVAIKVLPAAFAVDPERVARFEREAQALAALNHPNIAHIHGVVDDPPALVMECVEGEDLAGRISRGTMSLDEALPIARQIAEGLAAAHDRGIVHRDLKPANIKVSPDGVVKILDFGLAKAVEAGSGASDSGPMDLANSPTFTAAGTQMGVILGTAAYMSPEQARGKRVDHRADLWAFGCVLYEMLTGANPFQAGDDSVAGVLAKILERDPDFSLLPPSTPASIRRLIRRCLEKSPSRRLASAHDAVLEIDDAGSAGDDMKTTASAKRPQWLWAATIALVLALAAVSVALWRAPSAVVPRFMRYDIELPRTGSLSLSQWPPITISRDGSMVAFTVTSEGGTQIFLHRRDQAGVQPIAGTENGGNPVFSPDGRWLLFVAGRDLKKMSIGSAATTIGQVGTSRGATWLDDGSIVYSPDAGSSLIRLPAGGGSAQPLTTLDIQRGERSHRWPAALPGSKAVLFIVGTNSSPDDYNNSEVDAVVIATGERRHILTGASFVQYVPTGHLLFMRNGSINVVSFDAVSLTVSGTPVPVVNGVTGDVTTGAAAFASADDGTLVYAPGTSGTNASLRRIVWADRTGAVEPLNVPPGIYNDERISPDGSRFAVVVGRSGSGDVWVYDVARKTFARLTFDGNIATPIWSPDGRSIVYASIDPSGPTTFFRKPVDGSREPQKLAAVDGRSFLISTSGAVDRLTLVKTTNTQARVGDIVGVSVPDGVETPVVATGADEYSGSLSPDGRWLAYQSNESGRYEVYVRDMRESGGRWQISTGGGEEPRWSRDGGELFFRIDDRFMHARISSRDPFDADTPQKLFDGIYNVRSDTGASYDVDPKTGRFLMMRPADPTAAAAVTSLNVMLNWFEDLRRQPR